MPRKIISLVIFVFSLLLMSCGPRGWAQVSPEASPPPSGLGAIAFIDSSNTAILFGGITLDKWLNETWIWNGETWYQALPVNSPPAREKLAMEYDKSRNKVVLFGGMMDKTLFNDTWEWDGEDWKLINPSQKPLARCCHGMAYDSVNKNIIMYGGYDPNKNVFFSDMWKWDGSNWTEIPSDMPPMGGHAMINFPVKSEVISVQTAGYGTWSWDGNKWKNVLTENPPPRSGGTTAYDTNHQRIIFFGGAAGNQLLSDTWVFSEQKWLKLSLPNNPPARYGHVFFYDPHRESVVIFGGIGNGNTRFGDMWELKLPTNLSNLISNNGSYDGNWKGTTSQGLEITFTISHNAIITMTLQAELKGKDCTQTLETSMESTINPTAEATGNFTPIHPIENDSFTIANDNSNGTAYTFIGTFSSLEDASGTMEYAVTNGNCSVTKTFDWNAEKIVR